MQSSPNPTIADVLRQHGYQTIYSTDEVRFANIDEAYGFDQVDHSAYRSFGLHHRNL